MLARHREKSRQVVAGTVSYPGPSGPVIAGPSSIVWYGEVMDDYVQKKRRYYDLDGSGFPPSDCTHTWFKKTWVPLNGGVNDSVFWFKGHPTDDARYQDVHHLPEDWGKDKGNSFYVTKLLKLTNPARPVFSVPVAIKELVDLTSLFSLAAKSFTKFVGGAYLNYRFGWLQFINDINTLSGIVKAVNSRVKEINSLAKEGGLRRSVPLDNFGNIYRNQFETLQSTYGVTITGSRAYSTEWKIWGSVRWYPANYREIPTDAADAWLLAVRQVFDLEQIDSETLYQLIPWSWLLDYFSNLGDFLAANEGRALVVPKDICIMRELTTHDIVRRTKTGLGGDAISGGSHHNTRVTFTRKVMTESLSAEYFPDMLSLGEFKVVLALLARFRG